MKAAWIQRAFACLICLYSASGLALTCGYSEPSAPSRSAPVLSEYLPCWSVGVGFLLSELSPQGSQDANGFRVSDDRSNGYQLNLEFSPAPRVFAYARYNDMGEAELRRDTSSSSLLNPARAAVEYTSLQLGAGYYLYPVSSPLNLYLNGGWASIDTSTKGDVRASQDDDNRFAWGTGLRYRPRTASWDASLAYDSLAADIRTVTFSIAYRFHSHEKPLFRKKRGDGEFSGARGDAGTGDENASQSIGGKPLFVLQKSEGDDYADSGASSEASGQQLFSREKAQRIELCKKLEQPVYGLPQWLDSRQSVTSDNNTDTKPVLLNDIASAIQSESTLLLEVSAHSSGAGSYFEQIQTSSEVAAKVRTYLLAQGVQAAQLIARGYGPERPLVAGASVRNERVSFKILNSGYCE